MPQSCPRSYHHKHLDFTLTPPDAGGMQRMAIHSAEVLRCLLGTSPPGAATGYRHIGTVELPAAVAQALELVLRDVRTDLEPEPAPGGDTAPPAKRQRRAVLADRLEAFCRRNTGNPLVTNGVVIDPRSERGKRLVAQIRAGQAEPRLLGDWVRLRIEWRQIIEAF